MSRRYEHDLVAVIDTAITDAGTTPDIVASATDMDPSELKSRLSGRADFTLSEAVRVGGFLRLSPKTLLKGAGA